MNYTITDTKLRNERDRTIMDPEMSAKYVEFAREIGRRNSFVHLDESQLPPKAVASDQSQNQTASSKYTRSPQRGSTPLR